jgi:hypothetical protein
MTHPHYTFKAPNIPGPYWAWDGGEWVVATITEKSLQSKTCYQDGEEHLIQHYDAWANLPKPGEKEKLEKELQEQRKKHEHDDLELSVANTLVQEAKTELAIAKTALSRVWRDVNWMTNEQKLLTRDCFDYLDGAIEKLGYVEEAK